MKKQYYEDKIVWKNHQSNRRYYYTYYNDQLLLLRMNNFPDEPLYTFICELIIEDFDDLPKTWTL